MALRPLRRVIANALTMLSLAASGHAMAQTPTAKIVGGDFESVLPLPGQSKIHVEAFNLDVLPISNANFSAFVKANPQWRRDRVKPLLADENYLTHWQDATEAGSAIAEQPVTHVSWHAARAYCKARQARLPTWYEWEFAAAASERKPDARKDDAWRRQILEWYAQANSKLPPVGASSANFYGVRDLHGVIWEWVEDFNGMMVSSDSREQGDGDVTKFCGSGALTLQQKEQYAILMRVAMLSSLQAKYSTSTLGFRCATDVNGAKP